MTRASSLQFKLFIAFALTVTAATFSACTVRTPGAETPPPTDATNNVGIEKTFFETPVQVTENGKTVTKMKRKTFVCGWAAVSESTARASSWLTHATVMTNHCNMEFEITNGALIGRLINPSFPEDRNRWKVGITIPIDQHYYYEKAKDQYGRDTNQMIKNSQRSHESARPLMDLNFEHISIEAWEQSVFWYSKTGVISKIDDIEWDKANGFLAFTATMHDPAMDSSMGARVRFNFKAFEHNENFKKTPYHKDNARHLNALHVIGDKVDGTKQVWNAAKWDLSKTHDVYTHGFPDKYMPIAQQVIDLWNAKFAEIDPGKGTAQARPPAFRLNKTPMKYPFDLRYPMMVWVEDRQISAYSPLGIGMAQADVRNGEILWGQITLYGGYLESYVKGYLEAGGNSSIAKGTKASSREAGTPAMFDTYFNAKPFQTLNSNIADAPGTYQYAYTLVRGVIERNTLESKAVISKLESFAAINQPDKRDAAEKAFKAELTKRINEQVDFQTAKMMTSLRELGAEMQTKSSKADLNGGRMRHMGFPAAPSAAANKSVFGEDGEKLEIDERMKRVSYAGVDTLNRMTLGSSQDTDRRFIDVAPMLARAAEQMGPDYEDGLRRVILNLTLHEFGHFLGLGHQFKENVLPEKGSVPKKYMAALEKGVANKMTNMTSVMGYPHPVTEISMADEDIKPGFQDDLALRYLYNQEYPTFVHGSDADDFKFVALPPSGIIPKADPSDERFVTSYFPQCNDFQASFSADPYCNRWDRGFDAATIVQNYFDDLNINKVAKIHAFTDARGVYTDYAEDDLWWYSMRTLGRVRIFYDYMRQKFETELRAVSQTKRDLDEFSRACSGEITGSAKLEGIFKNSPELKELCRVNRMVMAQTSILLNTPGPDRSRMDWDNAAISSQVIGGDGYTDYSTVWGTHTTLSVLPIKLAAMNALTTPYPYTMLGGWVFPIPRFRGQDGLFSYSTLYSREFTSAMSAAIEKNLKVDPKRDESPTMGLPVLSMGYFLDNQAYGNDATRVPKEFIESIRNQSQFRLSLKAVIVELQNRGDVTRATQMVGTLFNPYSGKTSPVDRVFILPNGKLIVRPSPQNFVYPISKQLNFLDNKTAYAWAFHIEYDKPYDDVLASHGIKTKLETLHREALDACIRGDNNGLESFFSSQESKFKGFFVMDGIATEEAKYIKFLESVDENFDDFYRLRTGSDGKGPTAKRCQNALDGVGVIVSAAAILNGYWLPETLDQLATK